MNNEIHTISEKFSKRSFPDDDLDRIEREFAIANILTNVSLHDFLSFRESQRLSYFDIPLVKFLCLYKNIGTEEAIEQFRLENVDYRDLIDLINFGIKKMEL